MNKIAILLIVAGALCGIGLAGDALADPAVAAREIDAILSKDLEQHHLKRNPEADDVTFLRRACLDVAGRIPTYREAEEFLNSSSTCKRAQLIDRLLAGDGYAQNFFNFWADILRLQSRSEPTGSTTGTAYVRFIKDSLRCNKPYDQFVREIVSARGRSWENGAIGYYMRDRGMPLDNAANTVRIFLGTRIECAQCHNHPFDRWTQMQFHQMAAFTYGVETGYYQVGPVKAARELIRNEEARLPKDKDSSAQAALRSEYRSMAEALNRAGDPLRATMVDYHDKPLHLPHDYKYPDAAPKSVVAAATMMGAPALTSSGTSTLDAYAAWMTSPENPRFTRVIVNRLWKKVFGVALIEPLDELTDASAPAVPALEDYLERLMIAQHYDMKAFLRVLLNTQTYQSGVMREEVPPGVTCHFTGPVLRRMTAEQMWDSFVTLIIPHPDAPDVSLHDEVGKRLLGARKMNDALEALTPGELFEGAKAAAVKYREQAAELKELQTQIAGALARQNADVVKVLGRRVDELQRNAILAVNDGILVPAVNKLAEKGSYRSQDSPAPIHHVVILGGDVEMNMSKVGIAGYDPPGDPFKAEREAQVSAALDDAEYFGIPAKDRQSWQKRLTDLSRKWLRAADIESPAPRGHYLREFGQSDRELIENANGDASMPQALALMNGEIMPGILGPWSQIRLAVGRTPDPDQQFDAVYLSVLTRKPTPRERKVWQKAGQQGLNSIEDLIYSLLNTQQFIFIQ